ncbi:hypothetical protein GCM10025734_80230 [Kitasatospora paranensis]|uniref:hypothetical protein n=1 Tax=Kitasatospora paranensis TaxID=258053 RepID=UPI0031EB9663
MDGVVITVVLHLELGLHDGPLTAGLTLLPWSAGPAAGSWAAGSHLVPRYGTRVLHTGIAVLAIGLGAAVLAYRAAGPGGYPSALPAAPAVADWGRACSPRRSSMPRCAAWARRRPARPRACSTPSSNSAAPSASRPWVASTGGRGCGYRGAACAGGGGAGPRRNGGGGRGDDRQAGPPLTVVARPAGLQRL